jgi:Na+/melibiose symporter-like transporter
MNSTQKTAWIALFSAFLGVVAFAYVGSILLFRRMPPRPFGQIVVGLVAIAGVLLVVLAVFFRVRRQSPAEPEADERDKIIRTRAATISFAASWLLLVMVVAVLGLTLGQMGSIPVYLLTAILFVVAEVSTLAYGVAILVQYGRTGKGDLS